MANPIAFLRRGSAARRGIVAIMLGTVAGQVLAVLVSPVLSRMYTPADFGAFSVVSACAVTVGTVTALRYELAVPLPEDETDGKALVALGAFWCLVTGLILTIAAWLWRTELAAIFKQPELRQWLVAAPIIAAVLGLFRLMNQWALRQGRFAATARRNMVQSIVTVVVQLLGGWRSAGAIGLIGGLGAGQGIGAISMFAGAGLLKSPVPDAAAVRRVAVRYRRFPALLAPSGLMNAAGVYVPLLLVSALYGPAAAGWLGFTQRILSLPITLIGQSVAQVYLSELARTRRERTERQVRLFWVATRRLAVVGVAGAVPLLAFGAPLFRLIFGDQWRTSGSMAQALAVSLAAQLVASTLSQTLIVFERNVLQLLWDSGRLIVTAGAVVLCSVAGLGLLPCIWALSIVSAIAYAANWEASRRTVIAPPDKPAPRRAR